MRRAALALLAGALAARAAVALDLALPAPGTAEWQPLEFPGIPQHTRYEFVEVGQGYALRAVSECAASALVLPLEGIDLRKTPRLRWRWKVEMALDAPSDERAKEGDDFAARVYVTFAFVSERAGLLERARHHLGASLYGDRLPGSAINYVWTRAEPLGAIWENPFAPTSKMVSLGRGTLNDWRDEEVDLLADYERLFRAAAPAPLFLALMTDSDNTCQEARAFYADFRLLGRAADAE